MRLIFHGELRKLYGESAVIHANNISDAIEGFSRQQSDWPRDMLLSVAGCRTPDDFKASADEIHILPALAGGGGKFGTIIMGAALIAIAAVAAPATGGIFASAISASLFISGSVMIAQGVLAMFMKAPTMKSANDPEASKYLSVNRNTTDVGTPMTMSWGRIDLAGHWLSLQSDSSNLSHGVFPANPT